MKTQELKSITKIVLFTVLGFGLMQTVACSKQSKSQTVSRISQVSDISSNDVAEPGDDGTLLASFTGAIINTGNKTTFKNAIDDIVGSFLSKDAEFGDVSASPSDLNTGVRFKGDVSISGGFDVAKEYNINLGDSSNWIHIFIRDSIAAKANSDYSGFQIKGLEMSAGSIKNKRVSFRFENALLIVDLEGSYRKEGSKSFFYGNIYYTVKDGGSEGKIGTFYIPVCDFFNCK